MYLGNHVPPPEEGRRVAICTQAGRVRPPVKSQRADNHFRGTLSRGALDRPGCAPDRPGCAPRSSGALQRRQRHSGMCAPTQRGESIDVRCDRSVDTALSRRRLSL